MLSKVVAVASSCVTVTIIGASAFVIWATPQVIEARLTDRLGQKFDKDIEGLSNTLDASKDVTINLAALLSIVAILFLIYMEVKDIVR